MTQDRPNLATAADDGSIRRSSSPSPAGNAVSADANGAVARKWGEAKDSRVDKERLRDAEDGIDPEQAPHGIAGSSAALNRLRAFAARIAPTNVTVLISGETGTGKDCFAAMIHKMSLRAQGPLVAVNCAAIPDGLLEGELFGYERGAFTGALNAYPGKLKLADGGTLFLDEVGELSLSGQAKVLRAIETGEIYRLGARAPTRFNARIIAATNRDLLAEVAEKRFRDDLYYRIAVARLEAPPLRERAEDVAPIARRLLATLGAASGLRRRRIDAEAMARLEAHRWPGNVRELRNVIEIAMVMCDGDTIRKKDLPSYLLEGACAAPVRFGERERLMSTLKRVGGNKSEAAKALNCSRMTLYRKLARLNVEVSAREP